MNKVGQWIRTLRMSRGWTQKRLGTALGVSEVTVRLYEREGLSPRTSDVIRDRMSEVFGLTRVGVDSLCEGKVPSAHQSNANASGNNRRGVPVRGVVAASAQRVVFELPDDELDRLELQIVEMGANETYALRIEGDSMAPVYGHGWYLVVRNIDQHDLRDGEDAVFVFQDGSATFKRAVFLDRARLKLVPINPQFPPTVVEWSNVQSVARVIGFWNRGIDGRRE